MALYCYHPDQYPFRKCSELFPRNRDLGFGPNPHHFRESALSIRLLHHPMTLPGHDSNPTAHLDHFEEAEIVYLTLLLPNFPGQQPHQALRLPQEDL